MANGATLSFLNTGNFVVANDISITGNATITPPSGTVQTLTGAISDGSSPGTVNMSGTGTLLLSGTNTYTGLTSVNAGVLQGGATNVLAPSSAFTVASGAILDLGGFNQAIGSLAGAGVVRNSGAGMAVLTEGGDNTSTVFSGVIRDDGPTGLTKTGNGTLTLSGVNTYTGPTTVDSGTLAVDGSIASSSLTTVMFGATLSGSGTTGALQVQSGGVFAPGSGAPGSSTSVSGALVFNPGATYRVQVSGTTASLANVTGTASLAGDVQASFVSGSNLVSKYTILTASGGLGGTTFSSLTEVGAPGFAESLTYDPNDVYLNFQAALGAGVALNGNQQSVANGLNTAFNNGASLPSNFVNLYGLTGAALTSALTQLSGEASTGARQTGFLFTSMFLSQLLDSDTENRGGGPGSLGAGCAGEDEAQSPAAPASTRTSLAAGSCAPHWTTWGAVFGGGQQLSGTAAIGSHDASTSAVGFSVGADYHISQDEVVGVAVAGGPTTWSLSGGLGNGHDNIFEAALYSARAIGPAYVAGALTFDEYWVTINRTVAVAGGGPLNSSFNAQGIGGRLEAGYHALLATVVLTPYAAVQAQSFQAPFHGEQAPGGAPGFALNYASAGASDTRVELGAWLEKTYSQAAGNTLKLFGRLAWVHGWQGDPALTANFQSVPTASFVVNGARPAPDQALVTAGAGWRIGGNWSLTARFEGQFGAGSETYAGIGRLSYSW
jgi:autotransporter-associated beta strand protein